MTPELLKMLARELVPYLREELFPCGAPGDGDDWVDVTEALPSRKRHLMAACRTGKLKGRKVARRWLVRRRELDRWIESHGATKTTAKTKRGVSYIDGARLRLGLRSVG